MINCFNWHDQPFPGSGSFSLDIKAKVFGSISNTIITSSMSSTPKLFQPIQFGDVSLQHRVVLAPLTRKRGREDHVHNIPIAKEYYTQRASHPGTLLITEATYIAAKAGGFGNVPGIWSDEQISAWKEVSSRRLNFTSESGQLMS